MTFVWARAADGDWEAVRRRRTRASVREQRGLRVKDRTAGITKPPFGMRSPMLGTAGEEKRQSMRGGRRESARILYLWYHSGARQTRGGSAGTDARGGAPAVRRRRSFALRARKKASGRGRG